MCGARQSADLIAARCDFLHRLALAVAEMCELLRQAAHRGFIYQRRMLHLSGLHALDIAALQLHHFAGRERTRRPAWLHRCLNELTRRHPFIEVRFDIFEACLAHGPLQRIPQQGSFVRHRFPLKVPVARKRDRRLHRPAVWIGLESLLFSLRGCTIRSAWWPNLAAIS